MSFEGGGCAASGAELSEKASRIVKRSETAIAIVSGGMDSVTLAYLLDSEGYELHLLSVDYGQRHKKEISYAKRCAERLGAPFDIADISEVGRLLSGSALTDDVEVPHGHYAADNMAVTVVPNRNAIMLSLAYGVAVARDAVLVACAVHAGDHYFYPDCRPAFAQAFDLMQKEAVEGFGNPKLRLHAPFLERTKAQIVEVGATLGVPYEETWSCYDGSEVHCGLCGTCNERKEAFELAGVPDPTEYAA
jgi:7-cyano-7-deazaguanine synthase